MPIPSLYGLPDANGYSVDAGTGVLRIALDGGIAFYRADKLSASSLVNVQWTLDPLQYNYMIAFYRRSINQGSDPFYCNLILDNAAVQSYLCQVVPASWKPIKSQSGLTYVISAQLEIQPTQDTLASQQNDNFLLQLFSDGYLEFQIGSGFFSFTVGSLQVNDNTPATNNPVNLQPMVFVDRNDPNSFYQLVYTNGFLDIAPVSSVGNPISVLVLTDITTGTKQTITVKNGALTFQARSF